MADNLALQWQAVTFAVQHGFWMKEKVILHAIDLEVPAGSVLGLVGPNGAGKTTTLKLGAGLLQPATGQVFIEGLPAIQARAREPLGLLTETQYIYPHLRLKEWLIMMAGLSGLKGARIGTRVAEVLSLLELSDRADQLMRTLSKGQTQRAGMAQALLHEPRILLLDEPMSGLDPYWRYRMQKIIQDFKLAGGTIVFSSHILVDVERLCDKVALIHDGKLHWQGRLSDMPRSLKGYDAVCHTANPAALEKFAEGGKIASRPEGGWILTLSPENKNRLLQMVAEDRIILESLRPIQEEIEEVLFSFTASVRQADRLDLK